MSIWKLRLGLNPFTLLLSVLVGLVLVVTYFYMLSFLLGAGSPDQGPGSDEDGRRRLLWGERAPASSFLCAPRFPLPVASNADWFENSSSHEPGILADAARERLEAVNNLLIAYTEPSTRPHHAPRLRALALPECTELLRPATTLTEIASKGALRVAIEVFFINNTTRERQAKRRARGEQGH